MRILSSTSKPITSPGRTEKFPPPLMRFLRSNVGNASKGRTKATPLFMRRKKAIAASSSSKNTVETQEPSSPKVTCIGQVRVRRCRSSKSSQKMPKNSSSNTKNQNPRKNCCYCCCCCWFQKPTFCGLKMWMKPSCKKWVFCVNCRSVKVRTDSSKFGSSRFEPPVETMTTTTTTLSTATRSSSTPPKNALLLTRCRSAPYRSSSLVCQMWGEKEEEEAENRALGIELCHSSSSSRNSRDSASKSRGDQDSESLKKDIGNCDDFEHESKSTNNNYNNDDGSTSNSKEVIKIEDEDDDDGLSKPLALRRCKSEPARWGSEKYDPESSEFWRHRRRLGNTQSSTQHSHDVD